MYYFDDNDNDKLQTPPSLQARVGGAFFFITSTTSTSTRHRPHPRFKRESVGPSFPLHWQRRRQHVKDPTLASNASRWGLLFHYINDNDNDTAQTPPSLQARVGGAFFFITSTMSTSTHHRPHPHFKHESVGSFLTYWDHMIWRGMRIGPNDAHLGLGT